MEENDSLIIHHPLCILLPKDSINTVQVHIKSISPKQALNPTKIQYLGHNYLYD